MQSRTFASSITMHIELKGAAMLYHCCSIGAVPHPFGNRCWNNAVPAAGHEGFAAEFPRFPCFARLPHECTHRSSAVPNYISTMHRSIAYRCPSSSLVDRGGHVQSAIMPVKFTRGSYRDAISRVVLPSRFDTIFRAIEIKRGLGYGSIANYIHRRTGRRDR